MGRHDIECNDTQHNDTRQKQKRRDPSMRQVSQFERYAECRYAQSCVFVGLYYKTFYGRNLRILEIS